MTKNVEVDTDHLKAAGAKAKLKEVNNAFNERLKEILSGDNHNYKPLELGMPSPILLDCGMPDLPVQMAVHRLVDKKLQANHPFSIVSIVNLPECLHNPIFVFDSKTRRGDCKVVLTDLEDKGVNIAIVIEMNKLCGKIQANSVRSVYPKDNIKDILSWIVELDLHEYIHKQKALNWLGKQQSISADVARLIESCTNVVHKCE